MKTVIVKCLMLMLCIGVTCNVANAQTQTKKKHYTKHYRHYTKRKKTAHHTVAARTPDVKPTPDTAIVVAPPPPMPDSIPIPQVKQSLRPETALDNHNTLIADRTPLPYQNLRAEDAAYDERLWLEVDAREKINQPFMYPANEDNGNQRFISILLNAIQKGPDNGGVTAFSNIDDRFTTPMTRAEVAKTISGGEVSVPITDSLGNVVATKTVEAEVNLDSFYRFRIKEEVIFDKQSSRLFFRILGIAPVKDIITSSGIDLGETPLFWVYYPDMRPIFAKYFVYNGKNYGARMSWEDLFESRMFHGRIIKSTLNNPYDQYLKDQIGLKGHPMLQLYEGEKIKNEIFDYEQNLWSY
ncbi:MAG TPA: gliding motility protein GldN [Hanamia sp.]|nr:gliding motility protein GldN [Hanamia sp.]